MGSRGGPTRVWEGTPDPSTRAPCHEARLQAHSTAERDDVLCRELSLRNCLHREGRLFATLTRRRPVCSMTETSSLYGRCTVSDCLPERETSPLFCHCHCREGECSGCQRETVLHWFGLLHRAQINCAYQTRRRLASSQAETFVTVGAKPFPLRAKCSLVMVPADSTTLVTATSAKTSTPMSCGQVPRPFLFQSLLKCDVCIHKEVVHQCLVVRWHRSCPNEF